MERSASRESDITFRQKKIVWLYTIDSVPWAKMNKNADFRRELHLNGRSVQAAMQGPADVPKGPGDWTHIAKER